MPMYRYVPSEEFLFSPFMGHYRSFGIAVFQYTEKGWERKSFFSDVSTDPSFVTALAQRCTRGQLSPDHLLDVLFDSI